MTTSFRRLRFGVFYCLLTLAPTRGHAGVLDYVGLVADDQNGVNGLAFVLQEAISADGRYLYAPGASDNAVAVFERNTITGELTFIEAEIDGIGGVDGLGFTSSVAISPDGTNVYATGSTDNAVAVFTRSPLTGSLTFVEAQVDGVDGVQGLQFARSVSVSPDGRYVYVAGQNSNALAVFARDGGTGALSFVTAYVDGLGGVDGLNAVLHVALSPDGSTVYTAAYGESAIAVFARNTETGLLTFVQTLKDGQNGVDGLQAVHTVIVSGDGLNAYAAGQGDGALVTFTRNLTSGVLTFVGETRNGDGGADGLGGALWVTRSPDDQYVFVASTFDSAIAVFRRDVTSGALSFVEAKREGLDGVQGIAFARSAVTSPDGLSLYVGGASSNAIAIFRVAICGDGILQLGEDCDDGGFVPGDCCSATCTFEAAGRICRSAMGPCDAAEECTGLSGACPTDVARPDGVDCDDGNACTVTDACQAGACEGGTPAACAPCETCEPATGCVIEPQTACREPATPRSALLKLKRGGTASANGLSWEWRKGAETTRQDFGDPIAIERYTFCVYGESQSLPNLVLGITLTPSSACATNPGSCWRQTRTGYKYRDASRSTGGIARVDLRAGGDRKAKIAVAAQGMHLPFPILPIAVPLRVQLQSSNGACWEAFYPSVGVHRDDADGFSATSE